ncbi:hypothetical protein [Roseiterribacter gracilis]|uniref:hypothetical protein n=1 Tax=Roseiterribacter gracilis TaxID=2812848 RepID=UPI003B434B48
MLPSAFEDRNVLEVAPGGGHNSLYVASLKPHTYTLVEPNETARGVIARLYSDPGFAHTKPEIVPLMLQAYDPATAFDVVICESWLGNSSEEIALLAKLGGFVRLGGALVVTAQSPLGLMPNLIRKSLGLRLVAGETDFDRRRDLLVEAYGPHLATMKAMSRPHGDWVLDNPLNPAYCGIALSMMDVLDTLGAEFAVLSSAPRFADEWRWYKSLEVSPDDNAQFRDAYNRNLHNFVDHLAAPWERDPALNVASEALARTLVEAVRRHERGDVHDVAEVLAAYDAVIASLADLDQGTLDGLHEARRLLADPKTTIQQVAESSDYGRLFGRELQYFSLTRERPAAG